MFNEQVGGFERCSIGGVWRGCSIVCMRLSEFRQLIEDEFGDVKGEWVAHSHVLGSFGMTADEAVESGADLRDVWNQLCNDYDIPEARRLGVDSPGR